MGLFSRRKAAPEPDRPTPTLVIDRGVGDPAAAWLRARLAQRDWPAARDFLATVNDPDDRAFYVSICAGVDGLQDWIGEWVTAERHATLPLLVQGAHAVYWAWQARGGYRADQTSEAQFREFFKRLRFAENCLDEVVDRDPDDTTAWTFLVTSARGRQLPRDEAQRRFDEVVRRHPHHLLAHAQMLQYLCRKWYGSHEEMFGFARTAAAKAPAGSHLGRLVADAHIERWLDLPSGEDVAYMTQPEVRAELHAAADQSVRHPYFQRRPGWPGMPNTFAFAFVCAGEWGAAVEQFDAIGDLVTESPWQYFRADAASAFLELREDAYRHARIDRRAEPGA